MPLRPLDGAYVNAQEQGLKGVCSQWLRSTIECHNEWEITFEEIHRNGDIAYAPQLHQLHGRQELRAA